MSHEWSTFGKFKLLVDEAGLLPTQFVSLCAAYRIQTTDATISRALKAGKFAKHGFSETLRPLVLALEDLAERAKPFRISFEDAAHIKMLLTFFDFGFDVRIEPISVSNQQL